MYTPESLGQFSELLMALEQYEGAEQVLLKAIEFSPADTGLAIRLSEVFLQTGANSQVLKTDGEDMQNRAHDCFFSGAHAAKDSTIAWVVGAEAGINMPLAAATKQQFDKMVALGLGHLDKSGVAELTFKGRHA